MNQEKSLIKKTAIYAVGNFGSKILSYIMVLVYSHFILAEDLGYYDLVLTTVAMLQPIITFQVSDGVYRFLVNNEQNAKLQILSTTFKFLCVTTLLSEIAFVIFALHFRLDYVIWVASYLAAILFYFYFHEAIRGLGESEKYAVVGILNSIIMLLVEFLGLLVLKQGVVALLSANVISMLACIVLMIVWTPEFRLIMKEQFNKVIFCELLHYSAPLVPNTICWWVVNSSDRYLVLAFLGTASNGIYSISNKFPTILTTLTGIFYLAWQETAIKEYDSPNRDAFFSAIFRKYYVLLLTLCICAIPMTHIVIELFVGAEYKSAWMYAGFLYLGAVFSALCSFLGLGYQISKETSRSLFSSIIAAFINFCVNIMLITFVGLHAASLSTFIAYFSLFFVRIKHTKRYFILSVAWQEFYGLLGLALVVLILTVWQKNMLFSLIMAMLGWGLVCVKNKELLIPVAKKILRR